MMDARQEAEAAPALRAALVQARATIVELNDKLRGQVASEVRSYFTTI